MNIEIASYTYIAIGPDAVWRWSDDDREYDGYEAEYVPMNDGQILMASKISDEDEMLDTPLEEKMGSNFLICDDRESAKTIVRQVANEVENLSFETLVEHIVFMTYNDIINNISKELYFG